MRNHIQTILIKENIFMRNFKLKFLSVLLAVIMFVTFVPNSVYAAVADLISYNDTESTVENDTENGEEGSSSTEE